MHTFYRHDIENEDDWDSEAELSDFEPFPGVLLDEGDSEVPWIEVANARRGGTGGCSPTPSQAPLQKRSCLMADIDAYASREARSMFAPTS